MHVANCAIRSKNAGCAQHTLRTACVCTSCTARAHSTLRSQHVHTAHCVHSTCTSCTLDMSSDSEVRFFRSVPDYSTSFRTDALSALSTPDRFSCEIAEITIDINKCKYLRTRVKTVDLQGDNDQHVNY